MIIKKWSSKAKLRGDNIMNYAVEHKPGNVLLSLKNGFKEIKEHKKGEKKLRSLKECEKMWEKWAEEDE